MVYKGGLQRRKTRKFNGNDADKGVDGVAANQASFSISVPLIAGGNCTQDYLIS